MNRYTIKFSNGQYLSAYRFRGDTRKYTDDIKEAHLYSHPERIIEIVKNRKGKYKEDFKGALIVHYNTGEIVHQIKIYDKVIDNTVLRKSEKAILVRYKDKEIWLPNSQVEFSDEGIGISDFMWQKINK